MSNITDEVLAIEEGFWTEADNPQYFKEHVAEGGLTVIEPMGFVEKQQAVKMTADKLWDEVEMLDVQIRQVTPDCVIVAYHGRGRRGDEKPYQGSIAPSYVRQSGHWQLALLPISLGRPTSNRPVRPHPPPGSTGSPQRDRRPDADPWRDRAY